LPDGVPTNEARLRCTWCDMIAWRLAHDQMRENLRVRTVERDDLRAAWLADRKALARLHERHVASVETFRKIGFD
jgi:hypothetical protein